MSQSAIWRSSALTGLFSVIFFLKLFLKLRRFLDLPFPPLSASKEEGGEGEKARKREMRGRGGNSGKRDAARERGEGKDAAGKGEKARMQQEKGRKQGCSRKRGESKGWRERNETGVGGGRRGRGGERKDKGKRKEGGRKEDGGGQIQKSTEFQKKIRKKNHRNQTSQCKTTPIGRLTQNGMDSSHLAAKCATTSSSCATFEFPLLLGPGQI